MTKMAKIKILLWGSFSVKALHYKVKFSQIQFLLLQNVWKSATPAAGDLEGVLAPMHTQWEEQQGENCQGLT